MHETLFECALYFVLIAFGFCSNRTISIGEKWQVNVKHMDVNITLTDVETAYAIKHKYAFFVPSVSPECECSCQGSFARCSEKTHESQKECALLVNATTTCTVYNEEGENPNVCAERYSVCCQVYFTKFTPIGKQLALSLKYHRTLYSLKVRIKHLNGNFENVAFTVSDNRHRILLSPDIVLDIPIVHQSHLLPETWYFASEKAQDLLFSSHINDRFQEDLTKIGWFKENDDGTPSRVGREKLKKHFNIQMNRCTDLPPNYTWTLSAIDFYNRGEFHFPPDIRRVLESFPEISDFKMNLSEGMVVVKGTILSNITIALFDSSSPEGDRLGFRFASNVTIENDAQYLYVHFTRASGEYEASVAVEFWDIEEQFKIVVDRASKDKPFLHRHKLKFSFKDSFWVCIRKHTQYLCQINVVKNPQISSAPPTNASSHFRLTSTANLAVEDGNNSAIISVSIIYGAVGLLSLVAGCLVRIVYEWKLNKKKPSNLSVKGSSIEDTESATLTTWLSSEQDNSPGLIKSYSDIWPLLPKTQGSFTEPSHSVYSSSVDFAAIPSGGVIGGFLPQLKAEIWKPFGRQCGLTNSELDDLVVRGDKENWNFQTKSFEMLKIIQQRNPSTFNRAFLEDNLKECEIWEDIDIDPVTACRKELEKMYKSNSPQHLALTNENIFLELFEVSSKTIYNEGGRAAAIPLEDIFSTVDPKKTFVQGQAGSGKTSLVLKLAHDWANSKPYMQRFQLVFVIHLRLLKDNITDFLSSFLGESKAGKLIKSVKSAEERTLFLLDGLDELQPELMHTVLEFMHGNEFPEAYFLMTSRIEISDLSIRDTLMKFCNRIIKNNFIINSVNVDKYLLDNFLYFFGNDDTCKMKTKTAAEQTLPEVR